MRAALFLAFALALAGCSRPLAEGERAFARDVFGESFDVERARVAQGFGVLPASTQARPLPESSGRIEPRPGVCDRTQPGREPGPPPAFAIGNTVHVMSEWYRPDTLPGWPGAVLLPQALLMARELAHVWQWQNRRVNGYRPGRALLESFVRADPYFYRPGDGAGFLKYGYEQQATLIEDYLCYLLFDPTAPRRAELHGILAPVFPVDRLDRALDR